MGWYAKCLTAAAAANSLQSCPTLCNPIDGSPPGSPIPGILQARTLDWVDISFSNEWKWKWSRSVVSDSQRTHGLQPTRLLRPWDFPGKGTGVGCHCLLWCLTSVSSVQLLSYVWLFATPWIAARQASLSITNSQSSLELTSIESVMPSSHLILRCPLLLLPPIPPSIRVFSNESTLRMRWPKYWSFSFRIIPSKEIPSIYV